MPWIVVTTKPRQEQRARENIELQGHECYLPILREHKKTGWVEGPMFPRYLFVNIVDRWLHLVNTRGVLGLIMRSADDGPAHLQEQVIRTLMQRENKQGVIELPHKPRFTRGQRVRLTRGCFQDRIGIYQGSTSLERESVLLSLLGREALISVGSGSITAAA